MISTEIKIFVLIYSKAESRKKLLLENMLYKDILS